MILEAEMIEEKPTARGDILEFHASGDVTEKDYTNVVVPALERAFVDHDDVRLLVRIENNPGDYSLGAMMADARIGLKHWRGFDRIAVVSEAQWLTMSIRAFSIFMPCPVMLFSLAQEDEARRWLTESLGSIHQTDLGHGILHVQLLGNIDAATYAEEEKDLNTFIRANEDFKLLLDLRDFEGWQGLGAVFEHFALVRDHRNLVDKLALVGTGAIAGLARRLGPTFVNADFKYFEDGDLTKARDWLVGNGPVQGASS
ncbi:MAG: hypothetical protein ACJA1E_001497 [Paracoccaceae bacterium]